MSDLLDRALQQALRSMATAAADALGDAPIFRQGLVNELSPQLADLFQRLNQDADDAVDAFFAQVLQAAVADATRPGGSTREEIVGDTGEASSDPGSLSDFRNLLDTLFARSAKPEESALALLQALVPPAQIMAAGQPPLTPGSFLPKGMIDRTAKAIEKRLADLRTRIPIIRRLLRNLPTKTFDTYVDLVERELPRYVSRAVVATVIQFVGIAIKPMEAGLKLAGGGTWRDMRSDSDIGAQVHEELQDSYRETWMGKARSLTAPMTVARNAAAGKTDFILQEGRVYRRLSSLSRPLKSDAAISRDASVYAFWLARAPFQAAPAIKKLSDKDLGIYREDSVHMQAQSVWEIKPIRSASYAVFQEFHYRWAFNLTNALVQDAILALPGLSAVAGKKLPRALRNLGSISLPNGIASGTGVWWQGCKKSISNLTSNRKRRPPKYGTYFAVVLTVPQLPGVVLYVPFDLPYEYLAVLAPAVNAAISRLAKQTQDLIDLLEKAAETVVVALLAALAAIGTLVLMAMVFAAFAGTAPAWLPAAGAFATVMALLLAASNLAPEADRDDILQRIDGWRATLSNEISGGDVRLVLTDNGLVVDIAGGNPTPVGGTPERIDMHVGNLIQIRGLPLGLAPLIGELLNAGTLLGAGALHHAFPPPTPDPSAVT